MSTRWPTLRVLVTSHVTFAMIAWFVLLVASVGITFVTSIWQDIDVSVWHFVATQGAPWVALGLGIDAVNSYLRLHIAHGRTRGDFMRQLVPYFFCLAGVLALLVTLGYVVEGGLYSSAGWQHQVPQAALVHDGGNVVGIFCGYYLTFLLWTAGSSMVAAAFSRNFLLGLVLSPAAILLTLPGEALVGFTSFPIFRLLDDGLLLRTGPAVALAVAELVGGCLVLWTLVRDLPLRPKVN
ncbi:hypothetical protein [Actinophytocola oryzae]|uniref:ABC-2 type transport system permease protein n=1 Tax=Actinophytocola oryzae TaxID=502181 RepID=A0A4R7VRF9_9PSEU|nr:hypothetical protein [Actinophytocola oryzae]TDV52304.1 hypothetical protein CLV71_105436 [Actinophytocola oryzae]